MIYRRSPRHIATKNDSFFIYAISITAAKKVVGFDCEYLVVFMKVEMNGSSADSIQYFWPFIIIIDLDKHLLKPFLIVLKYDHLQTSQ